MEKHIILTISVLTSRKEQQVRRCLDSLEPIRREVPSELIVVDTSEDPHMREVLTEYTDRIIPFHWIKDFSAARNAGLREARGEWFLYLDDDEWFGDSRSIIGFFKSGAYRQFDGAMYLQRNYSSLDGSAWTEAWVGRMARIHPKLRFNSPIHEYFEPIPEEMMALRSFVHHYGYIFETEEEMWAHYERNHALIQNMIDQEPDSVRWRTQMIQEYRAVGKNQELFDFARDCLEYYKGTETEELKMGLPSFYAAKLFVYHDWNRHELAYQVCQEVQGDHRVLGMGQAYFDLYRAEYEMERGNYKEAEQAILRYIEADKYFEENENEKIMQSYPTFISDTFEPSFQERAYLILICAGLKQKNPVYLKKYLPHLLEKGLMDTYPSFWEYLLEAMTIMDSNKIFVRAIRSLHEKGKVWQRFETAVLNYVVNKGNGLERIAALFEAAGTDSSFVKLYSLRKKLSQPDQGILGKDVEVLLRDYERLSNAYYKEIFPAQDMEDNSSELPGDFRAAIFLHKFFLEEDHKKSISILRDVVESYPPFSAAIKRYAEYLGEQISEETAGSAATSELEETARQIMANVQVMLDNGMTKEAIGVVRQLREMLPGDQQLQELERQLEQKIME